MNAAGQASQIGSLRRERDQVIIDDLASSRPMVAGAVVFDEETYDLLSPDAFAKFSDLDRARNNAFYESVKSTLDAAKWVLIVDAEVKGYFDDRASAIREGTVLTAEFPFHIFYCYTSDVFCVCSGYN